MEARITKNGKEIYRVLSVRKIRDIEVPTLKGRPFDQAGAVINSELAVVCERAPDVANGAGYTLEAADGRTWSTEIVGMKDFSPDGSVRFTEVILLTHKRYT